jgi:hypothetical protein
MKPFKTLGGLALTASALLFVTSCTKSFDEQASERNVNRLEQNENAVNCSGLTINLHLKQSAPDGNFFFIGDKSVVSNRQEISGLDFTDNQYFDVIAAGGDPFHGIVGAHLGVSGPGENAMNQQSINPGEQLWFTLSGAWDGYLMSGFDVVLHGSLGTSGRIECYRNGELVATIAVQGNTAASSNFGLSFQSPFGPNPAEFVFFNQVRFICDAGRFSVKGPWANQQQGLLPPTKFYLANTGKSIYMRNQLSNAGAAFGFTNTYINQGFYPGGETNVPNFEDNRQYKAQIADGLLGSGEYNVLNPDKWLKISATGGDLVYDERRIGVGQANSSQQENRTLQTGESIIIEPGTDFPSGYFGGLEFREAVNPGLLGQQLSWVAYDGMTMVASGMTSGVDQNYNFINPGVKFNKVVISGTTADSRAGIGRPSNQVISAYPACGE